MKKRNSDKQIIFLEFGYVNAIDAPYKPDSEAMRDVFIAIDNDGNGLDDAQEQQANIYQAFFNTVDKNPAIVEGAFLWGESFPEKDYVDIWGVRTKLAEKIVRQTYAKWRNE
ncbi:hypothetical protein IID22_03955 [Patescibacteria group bacterium]|nr:hypothetical protein [Patescibacteria group bacterium]